MKKAKLIGMMLLLPFFLVTSCGDDGPEGPQGPQGDQGPQGNPGAQGPQGVAGNANVRQYTFTGHDFSVTETVTKQITTTLDTVHNSAWLVYLTRISGFVYPVPGVGLNGLSEYRVYWSHSGGKGNFVISKVSGVGELYDNVRIIRIYANTTVAGGRVADVLPADLDFNDYEAVCRYYGLPYQN